MKKSNESQKVMKQIELMGISLTIQKTGLSQQSIDMIEKDIEYLRNKLK